MPSWQFRADYTRALVFGDFRSDGRHIHHLMPLHLPFGLVARVAWSGQSASTVVTGLHFYGHHFVHLFQGDQRTMFARVPPLAAWFPAALFPLRKVLLRLRARTAICRGRFAGVRGILLVRHQLAFQIRDLLLILGVLLFRVSDLTLELLVLPMQALQFSPRTLPAFQTRVPRF